MYREYMPIENPPQRSGAVSALTGILCVLLFVFVVLTILLGATRTAISAQSIDAVIHDMDVGAIMDEFDVYETLAEHIDREVLYSVGVHPDTIDDLLDQYAVREEVSEILSGYLDAFITGDTEHTIPNETITRIFEDNADSIERATGHQLTDNDIRVIENRLNETRVLDIISVGAIQENTGIVIPQVQRMFSQQILVILLILLAVTIICLVLLNLGHLRLVFKDIGITLSIAGLLITVLAFLFYGIVSMLVSELMRQIFVGSVIALVRESMITYGVMVLVAGVVLMIVGTILGRRFGGRARMARRGY